ncbi:hypothetical protein [Thiohalorhabdus methylotrophus]|uniref:Uncharacterized protein n=1 Tax=Thiohalorhabdus methylotrophus TaxID=3242694 RepID=A0ABV4TTH0_9GAMM
MEPLDLTAAALPFLEAMPGNLREQGLDQDALVQEWLLAGLRAATRFRLPDGGLQLADPERPVLARGLLPEHQMREAPLAAEFRQYDPSGPALGDVEPRLRNRITLGVRLAGDQAVRPYLLAPDLEEAESRAGTLIWPIQEVEEGRAWAFQPWGLFLPDSPEIREFPLSEAPLRKRRFLQEVRGWEEEDPVQKIEAYPAYLREMVGRTMAGKGLEEADVLDSVYGDTQGDLAVLLDLCAALGCGNVAPVPRQSRATYYELQGRARETEAPVPVAGGKVEWPQGAPIWIPPQPSH